MAVLAPIRPQQPVAEPGGAIHRDLFRWLDDVRRRVGWCVDRLGITTGEDGHTLGVKVAVPTSAVAAGSPGQWAADDSFLYVCTATNTWRRVAIASW